MNRELNRTGVLTVEFSQIDLEVEVPRNWILKSLEKAGIDIRQNLLIYRSRQDNVVIYYQDLVELYGPLI